MRSAAPHESRKLRAGALYVLLSEEKQGRKRFDFKSFFFDFSCGYFHNDMLILSK